MIYIYICSDGEKTERLYFHPYKPVSWLLTHQGVLLLRIFIPSFNIYFTNLHNRCGSKFWCLVQLLRSSTLFPCFHVSMRTPVHYIYWEMIICVNRWWIIFLWGRGCIFCLRCCRVINHPPTTTKNIPTGIHKRQSSLSSHKASFD